MVVWTDSDKIEITQDISHTYDNFKKYAKKEFEKMLEDEHVDQVILVS